MTWTNREFTFQSGDIQIKLLYNGYATISYLHSNLVIFKYGQGKIKGNINRKFTFQSGDIQIRYLILSHIY